MTAPMPLAERPAVQGDVRGLPIRAELLHAYAALGREVVERVGPLMLQIAAGAAVGTRIWWRTRGSPDGERLIGTGMVVQRVV